MHRPFRMRGGVGGGEGRNPVSVYFTYAHTLIPGDWYICDDCRAFDLDIPTFALHTRWLPENDHRQSCGGQRGADLLRITFFGIPCCTSWITRLHSPPSVVLFSVPASTSANVARTKKRGGQAADASLAAASSTVTAHGPTLHAGTVHREGGEGAGNGRDTGGPPPNRAASGVFDAISGHVLHALCGHGHERAVLAVVYSWLGLDFAPPPFFRRYVPPHARRATYSS